MKVEIDTDTLLDYLHQGFASLEDDAFDLTEHGDRMYVMGRRHAVSRVAGLIGLNLDLNLPPSVAETFLNVDEGAKAKEQALEDAQRRRLVRAA